MEERSAVFTVLRLISMTVDERDDDGNENSCLTMLSIFSSRRHGEQSSDSKLPRAIR